MQTSRPDRHESSRRPTTSGARAGSSPDSLAATVRFTRHDVGVNSRFACVLVAVALGAVACTSSSKNGSSQQSAPAAPTEVTATSGDASVTVSWLASAGATSYNLYWSTSATVSKSSGTKVSGVSSGHVVAGLTNGTTYHFVVTALNPVGESAESAPVASATPSVKRVVTLSWVANHEAGVNRTGGGYRIFIGGAPVLDVPYVSGPSAPTTGDVTLGPGTYTVTITAYAALDSQGGTTGSESAPSQAITVNVPP